MFGHGGMDSERLSPNLQVLWCPAVGSATTFPCVDCGLLTGNFCDGGLTTQFDMCFACERAPQDYPVSSQRTPLCTYCETLNTFCRFCRGVQSCTPATRRTHWSGIPVGSSRRFDQATRRDLLARLFAGRTTSSSSAPDQHNNNKTER